MKNYTKKYLNNKCTEEEFKSFIDEVSNKESETQVINDMNEYWDALPKQGETPKLQSTLHQIHFEINKRKSVVSITKKASLYLTRVAAILLLPLVVVFYLQYQSSKKSEHLMQTVSTPLASKTSFNLPDGSKVWLNSGSTITYDKSFGNDNRELVLNGEAFFDVHKSKVPFQVKTPTFTVNVLGTAFNVMSYDHEVPTVTLARGKVWLETKTKNKRILKPGQQAIIDTLVNGIMLKNVEPDIYSAWINNKLIFENEPLGSVTRRLARWYNINVELKDKELENKRVTANIEFESIREVMELMSITLPIKYEYNKDLRKLIIADNNK